MHDLHNFIGSYLTALFHFIF